jgi:Uma2 family endonuclease
MATATAEPVEQRVVLNNVDWRMYLRMLRILGDRPSVRLTYDRGTLEIMTFTYGHESWAYILTRLISALTEELKLPIAGGGSTTFRRKPRRRGLEPDECFWIANEAAVRGKTRLDLRKDPPPDLAVEVEITVSALDRLSIYAAIGVPEVWRFDGQALTLHILGVGGKYSSAAQSRSFPGVTPADVHAVLSQRGQMDDNALVLQFREWIRRNIASLGRPTP